MRNPVSFQEPYDNAERIAVLLEMLDAKLSDDHRELIEIELQQLSREYDIASNS